MLRFTFNAEAHLPIPFAIQIVGAIQIGLPTLLVVAQLLADVGNVGEGVILEEPGEEVGEQQDGESRNHQWEPVAQQPGEF